MQVTENLREFSTCILADAVERLGIQLQNCGFTHPGLHRYGGKDGLTVVGYAATARIRTADPPITGGTFFLHREWWGAIQKLPRPRIAVIQDVDTERGSGASLGQIGAAVLSRLQCVGAITDGSVRDVDVAEMDFALFADHVSPSHAYAHLVEHSVPVEIHGLQVRPGDLLAADCHGVLSIPVDKVEEVCAIAADLRQRRKDFVALSKSGEFTIEEMENQLRKLHS